MYCRITMYCVGVLSALIFTISCHQKTSPGSELEKSVVHYSKNDINHDSVFLPMIDSVPMTLKFNQDQFQAFKVWWNSRGESRSITMFSTYKDSIYYVYLKQKPDNTVDYLIAPNGIDGYQLIFNTDTLIARNFPIIKKDIARQIFHKQDSIFDFYSFSKPNRNSIYNYHEVDLCHLVYHPTLQSYFLISLDTLENVIDSMSLGPLVLGDDTRYSIQQSTNSSLQLIRHRLRTEKTYTEFDISEIKRIYIDSAGQFFDFTEGAINPEKYCSPFPPDSTFRIRNPEFNSIPLSLDAQMIMMPFLKSKDPYIGPDRDLYESPRPPILFYQYLISKMASYYLFSVLDAHKEHNYLVLANKQGKIKDVASLFSIEHQNKTWSNAEGRLARDGIIHMVKYRSYEIDTLGTIWVEGDKILSEGLPKLSVTIPISNLDEYFSFHGLKEFKPDSLYTFYSYDPHMYKYKQFPDTIYKCIEEAANLNKGAFFGRNFNITHTSNGLTYLVTVYEGNLSNSLQLFVINKENKMQPRALKLAEMGGDAGDTWYRRGYFENDSTYAATIINCSMVTDTITECDSILTFYNIDSDGRIRNDDSKTKKFKTVRIYE